MNYADKHCTYVEEFEPEHVYVYSGLCRVTLQGVQVRVPADGLYAYRRGALMQVAFPDMPAGDREFLMSGMSPDGWSAVFGDEDEEADNCKGLVEFAEHQTYVCPHPKVNGFLVYCAACPMTAYGLTQQDAISNWKKGNRVSQRLDRSELTNAVKVSEVKSCD